MFQHTKLYLYPFQNLSLGFILKIFLKFRKFQPRYSNKIYSYIKKECSTGARVNPSRFGFSKIEERSCCCRFNLNTSL